MCPLCRADRLKIKKSQGLERILIFLTRKRSFLCSKCGHIFRAPDRRKYARGLNDGVMVSRRTART